MPTARQLDASDSAPDLNMGSVVRLHSRSHSDPQHEGLLALLVTDLEGFTPLVEQLGDEAALQLIRVHNRIVRDVIEQHGGREIAHTGDGLMASFRSVASALGAASAVQRGLDARTRAHPEAPLRARIGVHVGEPLPEEGRLFGSCVNAAVRVCAAALPQHVLVTDLVRQLAAGRDFRFSQHERIALKGLREPMQLHELLWQPTAATCPAS